MGDLVASGNDPGTQYQPSEIDPSGVYHEDREVTVSGGPGSQMFRVYGAQYNSGLGKWTLQSGVLVAYATVQNPDGSIHYFTQSNPEGWSTLQWEGSDNNTVYNAEDFGAAAGGSGSDNTAALASLFAAMSSAPGAVGGMAWIPQYNFPVSADATPLTVPASVIMQGLGTGGQIGDNAQFHFTISDGGDAGPYTFFYCSGPHNSGGTYFRNIAFAWTSAAYALDTVLYLNYFNAGAESCTFTGCATSLNIQGVGVGVRNCTITYGSDIPVPADFTAILVSGINCEISGPSEFNAKGLSGTTTACISIGGKVNPTSCNLITIRNLHITNWNYGIDYSDINGAGIGSNSQDNTIEGCDIAAVNTCVNLQPESSGGQIFNQIFSNNTFTKGQDSTNGDPIVFIDSNAGAASNIGPITLLNNVIYSNVTGGSGQGGMGDHTGVAQPNQYGVQIGTCESVSIVGGQISQVGTQTGDDGTANVCISGDPTYVIIDSVNLSPVYSGANFGMPTGSTGSAPSQYSLLISGNPGGVKVNNCILGPVSIPGSALSVLISNSTLGDLTVSGSVEELIITNCIGYNDQDTPINTLAHIATGTAYRAAEQGANGGTSYWGPSFVMFTAGGLGATFQYNGGAPQPLLAGQVVCLTLASPYDTIQFNTHAPTTFTWIGK